MQGDDPPFLPVGTDVSAKYKGAFCEAKIKKVVRNIKCKVSPKAGGGSITVNDDLIKGTLRVGSTVEVKQDPKKDAMEAIITKIQDCSQYTVVFDDGDITTLRRSALCLKSGRHFNESETLDQLPLTHPEHFSTPVIAGRRGRRGRAQSDESEGEGPSRRIKADSAEREPHVGRVVLVEAASGAERRRPHQPAFPALVVAPTAQIKVKEDYLVRSFKDGRYYTVPKKEAREFRKGSAPLEWAGVEAALQYLNNGVLPPHWDRDSLFNEPRNTSDDSSDDEPREEKDHFVAQLYKFMDDRGTPLNRNPTIANRDIDLYRLFRVVQKLGGYNRVTNQNQWKTIADKMGFHPVTTSITNLCKQAYKKFLHSFEDFYRKLGVTLVAHPRGNRTPPAGRSLIRDRDKQPPSSSSACSTPTGPPSQRGKDSDKSETEKSDKSEKDEKPEKTDKGKEKIRASDEEDSADNQPLVATLPKIEKEKENEREKEKEKEKEKEQEKEKAKEVEKEKEKEREKEKEKLKELEKEKDKSSSASTTSEDKVKSRSQSKTRTTPPLIKAEPHERRTPKRRPTKIGDGGAIASGSRGARRPHVSTDSDSSGRASRCGLTKKMQCRRSQSANSASSGNTIASNSSKRPRKRKNTETSSLQTRGASAKAQVGDKLKVYYGPAQSESKVTYEAKIIEISSEGMLRVHYTGWNTRYDEWIKPQRIALNVTQHEARNKKSGGLTRRSRAKRVEESSARSDTDSSDSDSDAKRPPKKVDDKSISKTPSRSKDAKSSDSSSSSKPRKRPIRTPSTPSNVSPTKKPRPNVTGRDFDLNEIRSELKGLHSTVKQDMEEIQQEPVEKESKTPPVAPIPQPEPPKEPEKQPEDVYEFKEPEPFEIELHDEKKKRTHRIFDDISPSKYTTALSKSLSEEIEDPIRSRPPLRSPSLSPFRDFGTSRDAPGRQSPEEDSKDGLFSLDDDSFPGEGSSGPIFEGFTPAKNQETYSKKSKVSKLRELIHDSPDSPADDEQSSDDDQDDITMKDEERELTSTPPSTEEPKSDVAEEEPKEIANEPEKMSPKVPFKELKLITVESIKDPKTSPRELMTEQSPMKLSPKEQPLKETKISPKELPKEAKTVSKDVKIPAKEVKVVPKEVKIIPKEVKVIPKEVKITPKEIKLTLKEVKVTKETIKEVTATPKELVKEIIPTPIVAPALVLPVQEEVTIKEEPLVIPEPPKTPPPQKRFEPAKEVSMTSNISGILPTPVVEPKIEPKKEEPLKILTLNFPSKSIIFEKKDNLKSEKSNPISAILDPTLVTTKMQPPSSPDTEEDKSEPDSPARLDVLPEPPPSFLLQSEGPKIAEKLLKAINSAKRLSMSPPTLEDRAKTPSKDTIQVTKPEEPKTKILSPVPQESKAAPKPDTLKPKIEPIKKLSPIAINESIFGEPSKLTDAKRDGTDVKKVEPTAPRLQSPLNIMERRKSVADMPLAQGKNNKVLSDTIQKLSSQIQSQAATVTMANIPLPPFPPEDRSDSTDSDDSDRRLIIDKASLEEWGSGGSSEPAARLARGPHAGKSPGEWSAGESLLMLEDACKNERKHSASVVVAGTGSSRLPSGTALAGPSACEEDSSISLLLCEETIPGSPAPDAEPAPARHRLHMPFASAPSHHSKPESRLAAGPRSPAGPAVNHAPPEPPREPWGRLADNTPPTTPDSSPAMSPARERRMSERNSPSVGKEDDEESRHDASAMDIDKPHGSRSRKASESSVSRGRPRRRRDTEEQANAAPQPLKYNFFVELDPSWDSPTRINVLQSRLSDLRKTYHSVKAELAAIDRRRKKLRRKEREAVKAAKAACS